MMDAIGQSAVVVGQEIIKAFDLKDKLQFVIDAFSRLSNLLTEKGLKGALEEIFPPKAQVIISMIAGAITAALIPSLIALAKAFVLAVVPMWPLLAVGAAIGALAYVIVKNWTPIKGFFQNLWTSIKTIVVSVGTAIGGFLKNWGPTILTIITGPLGLLVATVNKNWTVIKNATINSWNAIKNIVVAKVNEVVTGIKNAFSRIANIAKEAYQWGRNIIQGLINGITGMLGHVKDVAGNVASGIRDKVKNLLGISSPSKVMEDFGLAISEGLAKGIEEASGKPIDKATLMAQVVTDALSKVTGNLTLGIQVKQAQFDLLQAKLGETADESMLLQAKTAMLTDQLDIQADVVSVVQSAYERMTVAKGETAQETQELQLRLLQEQKTQAELETQLKQTNNALAGQQDKLESLNQQMQIANLLYDIAQAQLGQNATEAEKLNLQHVNLTKQLGIQSQITAELNNEYAQSVSEKGKDAKATQELYIKLLDAQKAQADLAAKLRDTNTAITEQTKKLEEQKEKVVETAEKYRQDMVAALNDYQNNVAQVNQKLADDERKLTADYENAISQRARSLMDWVSLFDAIPQETNVTGQQLLGNLSGQVDAFKTWQENLKVLAARGVDQGLISELEQMGPKASGEIAALLTLTDDELSQYVLLWQEKNSLARQQAAEELSGLRDETQTKIEELRSNTSIQLEQYRQEWEKKNQEIRDNTVKTLQGMVDEATKQGTAFIQALTAAISAAMPGLSAALTGLPGAPVAGDVDQTGQVADQKQGVTSEAQDQASQHVAIVQNEMAALLQAWTNAGSQLTAKQNEIKTQTLTIWQEIQQRLSVLWQKINADLTKAWTDNRNFVFSVLQQVDTRFQATVNAAANWGRNLINNFIAGIQSMMSQLADTLQQITETVDAYLGFHSPTKKGPGREADTWAPNLVKMFSSDLASGVLPVQKAVYQLAAPISDIAYGSDSNIRANPQMLLETLRAPAVNVEAITPSVAMAGGEGNVFNISITGSNAEEIWEQLERKLYRYGVRW